MTVHVQVFLHPRQDLYHSSKTFCGLRGLERQGFLRLQVVKANPWNLDPLAIGMILRQGDVTRKIVVDVRDRSDAFHMESLRECDVYFKRGYYFADVEGLSEVLRDKVQPFGLNFGCRGYGNVPLLLRNMIADYAYISLGTLAGKTADAQRAYNTVRKLLACPEKDLFEVRPEEPLERVVLFQTRVWSPSETTDDAEEVNEGRVSVVRALKQAFGDKFWGGLIPTIYAKERYPDLITPFSSRRGDYVAMAKRALVGVYSRGLHYSNACKLPEYFASSKAIVTDSLRQELPTPIREGVNYLAYHSAQECVEHCAELLRSPERVREMREANYRYYLEEIEPIRHIRNRIEQAFSLVPVSRTPAIRPATAEDRTSVSAA